MTMTTETNTDTTQITTEAKTEAKRNPFDQAVKQLEAQRKVEQVTHIFFGLFCVLGFLALFDSFVTWFGQWLIRFIMVSVYTFATYMILNGFCMLAKTVSDMLNKQD